MKLAVTGASGFVGSHIVRAARLQGHATVPIVRRLDDRAPADSITIETILSDPSRLNGADAILHAAAVRHRYGSSAADYHRSNVELTSELLATARGRVGRFVLVSSVGVYGFPSELPVTEASAFHPRTLYSQTKMLAEHVVRRSAPDSGLEYTIVRPTIIYGPGDSWGMLGKMVAMLEAHTYRIVGDGRNVLHHTFIDDVVDALLLASVHPAARNEDFIVAGPETTTLLDLSRLVAEALGRRVPRLHVPLAVARGAATLIDIAAYRGVAWTTTEPPVNHEKLDVMTVPIWFDTSKVKERLGFVARTGYREGIAKTLAPAAGGRP